MAQTSHFGLSKYGAGYGETQADVPRFATDDRDFVDAALFASMTHTHTGGKRVLSPAAAPGVALQSVGGALAPGQTLFYCYTLTDMMGGETAASPEISISLPQAVAVNDAPHLVNDLTTGTLLVGTYLYAVTALDAAGNESLLGPATQISVVPGAQSVSVVLPDLSSATSGGVAYNIWRWSPVSGGYTRIATGVTGTYLDSGQTGDDPLAGTVGHMPPQIKSDIGTYAVTVTIPAAVLTDAQAPVSGWKLYVSTRSGVYEGSALVHNVVETRNEDGTGGLVASYTDLGAARIQGSPPPVNQTIIPAPPVAAVLTDENSNAFDLSVRQGRVVLTLRGGTTGSPLAFQSDLASAGGGGVSGSLATPAGRTYALTVTDEQGTLGTTQTGGLAPTVPTGLAGTMSGGHMTLSWSSSTAGTPGEVVTGYAVHVTDAATNAVVLHEQVGAVATSGVVVTGFTQGSSYNFQVASINKFATSAYCTPLNAVADATSASSGGGGGGGGTPPGGGGSGGTPVQTVQTVSATGTAPGPYSVSWTPTGEAGVTGYRVEVDQTTGDQSLYHTYSADTSGMFTIPAGDLEPGNTWDVYVMPVGSGGSVGAFEDGTVPEIVS